MRPPMAQGRKKSAAKPSNSRAGRCAIVGRPNVGKSTLLNALLGQKLAIVAQKPQTTRTHILGVFASDDPPTQIAFLDTPGLHRPKNALGRALVENAKGVMADAEVIVFVTDVRSDDTEATMLARDEEVLETVIASGRPAILAINKVDRLKDKDRLFPILEAYQARHAFKAFVPIAALKRKGLEGLVSEIRGFLPEGRLYEDDEFVTDRPERFFAAEFVREAVIALTREEVPHSVAVLVERFADEDTIIRIEATILVEKTSQKKIVIGAGGAMLKRIGTAARKEIERMFAKKVFLRLWVKVAEGWTDDEERVRTVTRAEGGQL